MSAITKSIAEMSVEAIIKALSAKFGFDMNEAFEYLTAITTKKDEVSAPVVKKSVKKIKKVVKKVVKNIEKVVEDKGLYRKIEYSTPNSVKSDIEKNGVAVVKLFKKEECIELVDAICKDLENLAIESGLYPEGFKLNNADSWKEFILQDLAVYHGQMFKYFVGCCPTLWKVRYDKRIQDLYKKIYKCELEDLGVSYDGFSMSVNPSHYPLHNGGDKGKKWMHVDQSYYRDGMTCIQGFLNCTKVTEGIATFSCYKGSNSMHNAFFKAHPDRKHAKKNWDLMKSDDEEWYRNKGCEEIRLLLEEGDFVMWDSRTVHMGAQASIDREVGDEGFKVERCVFYVCYQKKPDNLSKADMNKILKKREKAEQKGILSCHWPWKELVLNGVKPRTYGDDSKTNRYEALASACERIMSKRKE